MNKEKFNKYFDGIVYFIVTTVFVFLFTVFVNKTYIYIASKPAELECTVDVQEFTERVKERFDADSVIVTVKRRIEGMRISEMHYPTITIYNGITKTINTKLIDYDFINEWESRLNLEQEFLPSIHEFIEIGDMSKYNDMVVYFKGINEEGYTHYWNFISYDYLLNE